MPVKTVFQVDIEIYKDKLSQSGNRILSSHKTKFIMRLPVKISMNPKDDF